MISHCRLLSHGRLFQGLAPPILGTSHFGIWRFPPMLNTPNWQLATVYKWNSLFKIWMIWGYHHFRKHPFFPGCFFFLIKFFPSSGNNHPTWLSYFSEGFKPPISFLLNDRTFEFFPVKIQGAPPKVDGNICGRKVDARNKVNEARAMGCRCFKWLQLFGMPIQWSQSNVYM